MNKIKTILIGLGKSGYEYDIKYFIKKSQRSHFKSLMLNNNYEITCLIEKSKKKIDYFKKKYNFVIYDNLKYLKNFQVDLISISTPSNTHLSIVRKVLRYTKVKTILLEKTSGINILEYKTIDKLCKNNSVNFITNYQRLFLPSVHKIKQKIYKKSLIKPKKVYIYYSGNFFHSCSHFISLLIFWFGYSKPILITKQPKNIEVKFKNILLIFSEVKKSNIYNNMIYIKFINGNLKWYRGKDIILNIKKNNKIVKNVIKTNINKYQFFVYNYLANQILKKENKKILVRENALKTHKFLHSLNIN